MQIYVTMICPLCKMRIKDSPAAEWQPRVEVPVKDPTKRVYAHEKCVRKKIEEND